MKNGFSALSSKQIADILSWLRPVRNAVIESVLLQVFKSTRARILEPLDAFIDELEDELNGRQL